MADQHFRVGEKFEDVKFHIPTSKKRTTKEDDIDPDMERLTEVEKQRNKAIHRARARVETTIHSIKAPWKILKEPWATDLNQLSYLIHIAAAVHNDCMK